MIKKNLLIICICLVDMQLQANVRLKAAAGVGAIIVAAATTQLPFLQQNQTFYITNYIPENPIFTPDTNQYDKGEIASMNAYKNLLTAKHFRLCINDIPVQSGQPMSVTGNITISEEHRFDYPQIAKSFSSLVSQRLQKNLRESHGERTYKIPANTLKQIVGADNRIEIHPLNNFCFAVKGSKGAIVLNPHITSSTDPFIISGIFKSYL